ncbi:MAG: hypothetical protein AAFV98_17645 [Chloroflexota bacterium]
MSFPILSFIETGQASIQDDLCCEACFDITGKDCAVTYLWGNHLINGK